MSGSRSRARGGHESKRTARLVFVVVCVVLLGISFGVGVLMGREWAQRTATALESGRQGGGPRETNGAGRGDGAVGRRGRGAASEPAYPQIQEKLTFYQTLPAPLGGEKPGAERAGKRDTKVERGPVPRPESRPPEPKTPDSKTPDSKPSDAKPEGRPGAAPESPPAVSSAAPAAYTVQVAAYRSRAQAEALRQALGEAAYVVEATAESGVTYRVRFGAYATRAEAEAAAARVRAERAVAAFITTR
jgi:cell division septation protein DedD